MTKKPLALTAGLGSYTNNRETPSGISATDWPQALYRKFLDHNLDLVVAFMAITALGLAYGSFGHSRLQGARQFADQALTSEHTLRSSFCQSADGQTKAVGLHDIESFQRDPAILTGLGGNTARVRLRQRRPHRAEYHPRRGDFEPRIFLVEISLDNEDWCVSEVDEQS